MPLTDGDFLRWYNEQITRCRNFEWQVAAYSIGISSAILLFAKRAETAGLIDPTLAAVVLSTFVLGLLASGVYVHQRLNEYRVRRES